MWMDGLSLRIKHKYYPDPGNDLDSKSCCLQATVIFFVKYDETYFALTDFMLLANAFK